LVAGNSISLSPVISGVGSTSSGVSGNLGVGKPAGKGNVNVGVGGGYTVSMPSGAAWGRTFTVDLNVVQPQAKIPDMISEMAIARFAVGSAQLEEGAQQFIAQWYLGLDSAMRSAVESGGVQLILRGHASTTKGVEANQKLSQRRVERVQEILRGLASSNARFKTFALGEYEATASGEQDNIENPDWRVVTIEIFFIRPSSPPNGQ
jgi:outer membrane protein OmpA-like peptidoglycan-associated protein